jgi:aquaporin Z
MSTGSDPDKIRQGKFRLIKSAVRLSPAFLSEMVGTALLISFGLSFVIIMFGRGSPLVALLPNPGLRRLITGFLFGSTGALVTISSVGKISGAHLNPAVTMAFMLKKKLGGMHALSYMTAQAIGAILGTIPLLIWGRMGRSVWYGATFPGSRYTLWMALLGEVATTFAMISLVFVFIGHKRLRAFTPLLFPFLYAIMVFLEAPISGTSTNPARSLGPDLVANMWRGWWIYLAGPAVAAMLAVVLHNYSWLKRFEIEIAKIYHFSRDPYGIFTKSNASS